ncbi:hypothetical protein Bca4012_042780 [Brassica carinata]|uniref:Uncharacterized protein n=2 Tax=Brassica TaxID=3705 RepID=A0A0D3E5V2_BRAOL|nr:PREDICTED: uncharacterized protein LOC106313955 [Brassica oleracea var. oleracea]XP_013607347.1 PREDICTED: uncharacterized protein LOC106313955 [Brassica oleracea var. oleracea]KAG2276952.1 hypothetical protein Bca52824_059507 [Brassica carinata]
MDEENIPMEDPCGEEYVCGDPKVDIRVGDEYQAEIPPLISESERATYLSNPLASESNAVVVGLPLDITWIDTKLKDDVNVDMNESLKSLKTKRNRRDQKMNLEAVPERSSSSWEDLEVDAFVLGLYTFGKNFTQAKTFLESKETGELLSFYYGKFYKSSKHKIWSNPLKKRSRKCIQGKKLYSGWRLHQLLSRLMPSITDESLKTKLVNVSKSLAEGNTSLEKYISSVKELVGLKSLVEAVAIGKDKEDLTVLTTEPVKSKQWFTVSSSAAVPAGLGVYSSLTCDEIIEKLGGGSRLSKARCNDIFWEAVWPRLLARGWRSEQPKDRGKDNIVFLIPGVKKFSRRKLVKQNHYFDSISDIIKKVVSDPELLEFDEAVEIRAPSENNQDQLKRLYLKSPESSSSTHMKFTVVDTTSLASGGKLCAFRELKNPNPESLASQSKASCVDVEKHGKECKWEKRRMKKLVEEPVRFMIVDSSGIRRRRRLPASDPSSSQNNQSGTNTGVTGSGVKEEKVRSKKRSVRKSESANNHSLSSPFPLPKRRKLSACVRKDIERFGESSIKTEKAEEEEEAGDGIEILRLKTEPNELCSSERQQQEESKQLLCSSKGLEEKLIQLPSRSGADKRNSPSTDHGTTQETASIKQEEEEEQEQEQNQEMNADPPRRQSTRKRPLTTRALEALESGFYTAKSTPKPIKRERSKRIKHSANASNRAQGESDDGFLVKESTSSKPLDGVECSEPSFLSDKATRAASKPVDETEDSNRETSEFSTKRPPILLKLPFKRG